MTPFERGVQRRNRYYVAIGLVVVAALAAGLGARQLSSSWPIAVRIGAPVLVFVVGVVWAVAHYLRCPGCERFDPILAYAHSRARTCRRCGAQLP